MSLFSNVVRTISMITLVTKLERKGRRRKPWRTPLLVVNSGKGWPYLLTQLRLFKFRD